MTKEAEYKCKYDAAYMMEHFDIAIMVDDGKSELQCYGGAQLFLEDRASGNCPGRILVDPEGPWPFEPQKGDVILSDFGKGVFADIVEGISGDLLIMENASPAIADRVIAIIYRNGKPFIMPEIK